VQNSIDAASDMRDMRELIGAALQTTSDAQMLQVLQIGKQEMPDAIKTLQRALERVVERERTGEGMGMEECVDSPTRGVILGKVVRRVSVKDDGVGGEVSYAEAVLNIESPGASSTSSSSGSAGGGGWWGKVTKDTLDHEFIESGIDALGRMSHEMQMETNLPSWTITKYEVDRESKIDAGFFSDVYKGTWRGLTVAVKVLTETTPRKLFVREIEIWKNLRHPNVLPLCGASSASGRAPWFFVSPYMKNGSLVEFLKRVEMDWVGSGRRAAGRGSTIPSPGLGVGGGTFGRRSPSGVGHGGMLMVHSRGTIPAGQIGDVSRQLDLFRFMDEIAKGMEYLHSRGVLHGNLRAANVLIDDKIRCVISDFGQSEMKWEAFMSSGTPLPRTSLPLTSSGG
jgi:abelson tyrosine-protein kinase 1